MPESQHSYLFNVDCAQVKWAPNLSTMICFYDLTFSRLARPYFTSLYVLQDNGVCVSARAIKGILV